MICNIMLVSNDAICYVIMSEGNAMICYSMLCYVLDFREKNCNDIKCETEDKVQTLVSGHKVKVRVICVQSFSIVVDAK